MRAGRYLLMPVVLSGCVLSGAPVSPYGRDVTVHDRSERVRGELIAVGTDTIWLLQPSGLRHAQLSAQRAIYVRRHTFGFGRTMRWMAKAGLGTGTALFAACNSYESSNEGGGDTSGCVAVIPATVLVFAVGGFLFGGINEATAYHRLQPTEIARLRAFSRYPQGLPDSLRMAIEVPGRSRH